MRVYALFLFPLLLVINLYAQPGCTDPQALNYDQMATINDGSCQYPETNYSLTLITELPSSLVENSGLVVVSQGLFTINDAGNPNELYRIDSLDGTVLQTLLVVGENEDWEDMAESDTHIFIGDFGNNAGNRTDLKVYRIAKAELGNNIVNAQPINFAFADQIDFSENPNNHNYDCEAFFYHDDSLHLFTKNWVDNQTRHYVIPAEPGFYSIPVRHSFNAQGLITSADISADGTILLLGYTEVGFNFMWLLFDYPGSEFFSGNKRRIELGSGLTNSQTEAIAFKEGFAGYISSEQFDLGPVELPPKLLAFNIEQWVTNQVSINENVPIEYDLLLSPNPFRDQLTIQFPNNWDHEEVFIKIYHSNGQLFYSEQLRVLSNERITLSGIDHWPSGIFFVQLIGDNNVQESKVIRY